MGILNNIFHHLSQKKARVIFVDIFFCNNHIGSIIFSYCTKVFALSIFFLLIAVPQFADTSCIRYRYFNAVPLEVLLNVFPNLQTLYIDGHEPHYHFYGLSNTLQHWSITSIRLSLNSNRRIQDFIQKLLLRCPNIRSLYVSPCALTIVKAIEQSSRIKLDHLVIADKIPRRYLQNKAATTTATTATITTGLKTLELHASTADPFLSHFIFTRVILLV